MYDQCVIDTVIQKLKYHQAEFSWSNKVKVKGVNIATMYNMVPYKSEVMNVEEYILNFPHIIQNRNAYPS